MLTVYLFGPTVAAVDGRMMSDCQLAGGKPRQILEILACELGSPVSKDRLADWLWAGSPPTSFVGSLESYVSVLRRRLGAAGVPRAFLRTGSRGYLLDPDHVEVDLAEFRDLTARALDATAEVALQLTEDALALSAGELLASEPSADWAVRARQTFQHERVSACVRAAQLATATGDHARAVGLATRARQWDPLSEEAGQQLMRALWLAGRRSQALRAYAEMRQTLLDELGDEPGPDSQDLYLAILRYLDANKRGATVEAVTEIEVLLRLMRQAIDQIPGVRAPASDARLSEVAVAALLAG
jgi:DNA-binding SARP family transcriptional activator